MKRQILIATALILLSVSLGVATYVTNETNIKNLFLTSLVLLISYLIFSVIIGLFLIKRIQDLKTRYTATKVVSVLSIVFIVVLCLRIWVVDTSALIVSLGIIGAALAFVLQDILKNFVGGILIIVSGYYRVGDRISIDEKFGDVMDIGLMNTILMEIRGWVGGDQPSGRLIVVPNGVVLSHSFINYTRDHSFVWDEISIPLTYESDWRRAKEMVLSILKKETEALTKQAEVEIEKIGERYYLPKKVVEPSVYISLTDNWITLDARYVTDARTRRILRSRLSELILSAIEKEEGITISSETLTVTTIQKTPPSETD